MKEDIMDIVALATLSQLVWRGFRGGLDRHGFSSADIPKIIDYAMRKGITDGDVARESYCAHLDEAKQCPHAR